MTPFQAEVVPELVWSKCEQVFHVSVAAAPGPRTQNMFEIRKQHTSDTEQHDVMERVGSYCRCCRDCKVARTRPHTFIKTPCKVNQAYIIYYSPYFEFQLVC